MDGSGAEKRLGSSFGTARDENAVLLFDEADSIAARRSRSPDQAATREANTVVNVLLESWSRFAAS